MTKRFFMLVAVLFSIGLAVAVQTATQQTPQPEPSSPSVQGPAVEKIELYLMEEGKPIQLTASSFSKQKVITLKMLATMGISKGMSAPKQKAELRGPSASIRTKNRRPEFFFYAPEGFSPSDYLALRLEKKSNTREAVVGAMSMGASAIRFSSTKSADKKYVIRFKTNLRPGEYCFYPVSELRKESAQVYDFGVDP